MKTKFDLVITNNWKPSIKTHGTIFMSSNIMNKDSEDSDWRLIVPMQKGKIKIIHSDLTQSDIIHIKKLPKYLDKLNETYFQVVLTVAEEVSIETI